MWNGITKKVNISAHEWFNPTPKVQVATIIRKTGLREKKILVSIPVDVKEVEQNKRILIEWPGYNAPTSVEWIFTPYGNAATFVRITNAGFSSDEDEIVKNALESLGGFTIVLVGAKAWLEHNIILNLIADRFPKGFSEHE